MPSNFPSRRPLSATRLVIGLAIVALGLYVAWNSSQQPKERNQNKEGSKENVIPEESAAPLKSERATVAAAAKKIQTTISGVTLKDQSGKVIFKGTIDVAPTLERIEQGKKLRFSHDGIVFENREGRLPKQPAGYYREYVHPTTGEEGPGPQRVVRGKSGETYYTADHYRSFQRLDKK